MNNMVSVLIGNMNVIKALKSKYIMVTPEYIYGLDEDFVILRCCIPIYMTDIGKEAIFSMDDLKYLYDNSDYIKDLQYPNINTIKLSFINSAPDFLLYDRYSLYPVFKESIFRTRMESYPSVDLTNDPEFNRLQEYKSGDGIYMYNHNGYLMSLYNNIIPRNKSDKVSLSISDQGPTFMACFTVDKKKIGKVHTYIRYIKL